MSLKSDLDSLKSMSKISPKVKVMSPQVRKSMTTSGSPRSPQPISDSHLYESDSIERPFLPECWTDTKRMTALMAPFRAREANPEGWDLKMNFWINCMTKWSLQSHSVVFSVEDVMNAYERGSKRPDIQCLQLVMSHMKRNKTVVPFDDFKAMIDKNSNKNWFNWGLNAFVVKPLSFGWSLVSNPKSDVISEEILSEMSAETKFVCIQTLQVMSEELNKYLNGLEDIDCIRVDNLFNKCKNRLAIDLQTFGVIISHLELENKLKVFVDNGIKIVKIGKNVEIRESDIGFIRLEAAKEVLETEVDKLETEIESIRDEAKVCVRNKNREKAILLLKKKKRFETKLSQKVIQLDNIDVLLDQLLNSNSQNLILQAFQRANEALKLANTQTDDIENTMNDVEETLDIVNDLVSDVSRPLVPNQNIDIDEELEDLLSEINDQKRDELNKTVDNQSKRQNEDQLTDILNNLSVNDMSLTEDKETDKTGVTLGAI